MDYFHRCLQIQEAAHGCDSIKSAITISLLGTVHEEKEQYEHARQFYQRAYNIQVAKHGEGNINTAISLRRIGRACLKQGECEQAMAYLQRCLRIQEVAHGKGHIQTAVPLSVIGQVHQAKGEHDQALECFMSCLRIQKACYAKQDTSQQEHPSIGSTYYLMGTHYLQQGSPQNALPFLQRAVVSLRGAYRTGHQYTTKAVKALAACEQALSAAS
jgi:tetratricopeptide (TPR) repeat protein